MATPTNQEQELLELLNRARANPAGEYDLLILNSSPVTGANSDITNALTFFGVDVSLFRQLLQSLPSVAPLAWNSNLETAASQHSAVMIAADEQSHQVLSLGEAGLGTRILNNGYSFMAAGENVFAYATSVLYAHAGFYIDWGGGIGGMQSPAGHRLNMLSATFTEIGIDITPEAVGSTSVGPLVITEDFGARFGYAAQIVGVVYRDVDGDNFYDAGEGNANVTVTATGTGGTFSTSTWSSGGYQLAAPAGTYTLTFSGGGLQSSHSVQTTIAGANVKVDVNDAVVVSADDNFVSTSANQTFDGGAGNDTVVYAGLLDQYTVQKVGASYTVADSVAGRDGTDTLSNMEHIQFSDRSLDLTMAAKAAAIGEAAVDSLLELYIGYFNRVPAASGLAYWIDQLSGGQSLSQISEQFYAAGVQFSSVSGYTASMSNADFIRIAYANVLGRSGTNAPPTADVQYWDNQITSGAITKGGLIQQMLHDAHLFAGDPTWGWVPQLLDNKIALGTYHAVELGLDYNSPTVEITTTVALAAAVAPTGITSAVGLIGLSDHVLFA